MALFRRPAFRSPPDFTGGEIRGQSDLAAPVPDIADIAATAIDDAGRPQADPAKVLAAIDRVLAAQMDVYANALAAVDQNAVRQMRETLSRRADFTLDMYFHGLTYFGPSGVAMANSLAEQLMVFVPELTGLIRDGQFDRSTT